MKQGTKLILAFVGAGVAANLLLSKTVAEATSEHPTLATGGEGLAALGGGYWAYRSKSMTAALLGGAAAGLLVDSVRASMGLGTPAPAPTIAVGEPLGPLTSTDIGTPAVIAPRQPTVETQIPAGFPGWAPPTKTPIVSPPIRSEILR